MNNDSVVSVNYTEEIAIAIIDKLKNSTTFQECTQDLLSSVSSMYIDVPLVDIEEKEKQWQRFATEQFLNGYDLGDAIYDKLSKGRRSNT